jgi:S-adenosylmethionine:tRNA ribosyltransferase-isomerase
MLYSPYQYHLPKEAIAQRPIVPYDAARMLVIDGTSELFSSTFAQLPSFLSEKDLLVFNNTKVVPARILGRLPTGARVELLLIDKVGELDWECLAKPMKRLGKGASIIFEHGLTGESLGRKGVDESAIDNNATDDRVIIRFSSNQSQSVAELMQRVGMMPIPPYIRGGEADSSDSADYQTRFAAVDGSIAAPTASLHFTDSLMDSLVDRGVKNEDLTLHVGVASFLPIFKSESPEGLVQVRSAPAEEQMYFCPALYSRLSEHRSSGGRVIAVGTTVVRALESMARYFDCDNNKCVAYSSCDDKTLGSTDLFIRPGHEFRLIDGVITNFHQPGTTHLLLVEALIGRARLAQSYEYALREEYRFLSYGDGMFIQCINNQ